MVQIFEEPVLFFDGQETVQTYEEFARRSTIDRAEIVLTIEKIASRFAVQFGCLFDESLGARLIRLPVGEQFAELREFTRFQFELQLKRRMTIVSLRFVRTDLRWEDNSGWSSNLISLKIDSVNALQFSVAIV